MKLLEAILAGVALFLVSLWIAKRFSILVLLAIVILVAVLL